MTVSITEKDRIIIRQVAFKAAVDAFGPGAIADIPTDTYVEGVADLTASLEGILLGDTCSAPLDNVVPITSAPSAQATVSVDQAVANVMSTFPGSTVVAAAPTITADSSKDELWQNLIVGQPHGRINERDWYDNRTSKKNPAGPDFAHKTLTKNGSKVALWLTGRYPAPGFVTEHFA